jgi:hypothetical protein
MATAPNGISENKEDATVPAPNKKMAKITIIKTIRVRKYECEHLPRIAR